MRRNPAAISYPSAFAAALALSAAGCGKGGVATTPNCPQVQPCGGDVIGSWRLLGGCLNVAAQSALLASSCSEGGVNGADLAMTGSFTLNADASYNATNWRQMSTVDETLPLSCTGQTTCAELNPTAETSSGSTSVSTRTCTGTTTCSCRSSNTFTVPTDSGIWQTSGTTLDIIASETSRKVSYCVAGDRLHMMTVVHTAQGEPLILSEMVAIRSALELLIPERERTYPSP